MCSIVDANVAGEVFGTSQSAAGEKFLAWIETGKGRLVVGGKLRGELELYENFKVWGQVTCPLN